MELTNQRSNTSTYTQTLVLVLSCKGVSMCTPTRGGGGVVNLK